MLGNSSRLGPPFPSRFFELIEGRKATNVDIQHQSKTVPGSWSAPQITAIYEVSCKLVVRTMTTINSTLNRLLPRAGFAPRPPCRSRVVTEIRSHSIWKPIEYSRRWMGHTSKCPWYYVQHFWTDGSEKLESSVFEQCSAFHTEEGCTSVAVRASWLVHFSFHPCKK